MNYLAHFYLSDQTSEGFVGSILGDFVRGSYAGKYTETIEREIQMHRNIDAFTDSHPITKQSKQRISAERSKYAGVLVDMFYDHFFAVSFEKYSDISLSEFSANVYQSLNQHQIHLPEAFRNRLSGIVEHDLLGSYKTLPGIAFALNRISKRIKRENDLAGGIEDLESNYEDLRNDFEIFFQQLIEFVGNARQT
jgi:acyl carrier protein phosphodiesterase